MDELAIDDMACARYQDILQIGREFFERHLKPKLYQEALKKIEEHKQAGDRVVLISSGPTMAVKVIEDYVAADSSFSIGPVIQDDILQNRLMEPFVYREGKILAAQEEAGKLGIPLQECYFYADTHHDIPLLSAVGRPSVVNPDRRLKKKALDQGWPILEFKHLLGQVAV